ncbi:hypothetical protein L195_g016644 [Trifolium pratense]|uniref:Uncharacterized protein n=1 Tax=Trifolium pratense TaxID=57577 RepID=A0A2K3MRP6_TRIPR|nr:hypothetical protein L195_g016644 [Trifolium pratense]
MVKKCLLEYRRYEEKDVVLWTDEAPMGVFADSDATTTYITEKMIVSHLLTLVKDGYLSPGDTILFFLSGHKAFRVEPSVIIGKHKDERLSCLRASSLDHVIQSVSNGVHLTMAINSCGSLVMIRWSQFQFRFVEAPFLLHRHAAS